MTRSLETRAELVKLGRLLGTSPAELAFLEALSHEELAELRRRATDALFDADASHLKRAASASKLLPASVLAQIASRVFGPVLVGRIAGMIETSRAIDVAARLPTSFLADVACELDPRRVASILSKIPVDAVVAVARELALRQEHITLGRLVGHVSPSAVAQAMAALEPEVLLRTAFVLEGKERLDALIGLVPPDRLAGVLRAADSERLWPEALALLGDVGDDRRGVLADLAADQGEAFLESLVQQVHAEALFEALLPVVRAMSHASRSRFARTRAVREPEVLVAIVDAAARHALWPTLLAIVEQMDRDVVERIGELLADADAAILESLLRTASRERLFPALLRIAESMQYAHWARLVRVGTEGRWTESEALLEELVPALAEAAHETGCWEIGLSLLVEVDPALKHRLVAPTTRLPVELRRRAASESRAASVFESLGVLGPALEHDLPAG